MIDESSSLLKGRSSVQVRTSLVAERIDPRPQALGPRLGVTAPLTVRAGEDGCVVLFRYGVVVLFGLDEGEEARFMERVRPFLHRPLASAVTDELEIVVDPNRAERFEGDGRLVLHAPSIERLQIVADVLASSVALDHYEVQVAAALDRVEPITVDLERFGRTHERSRDLLRHIGSTLLTEHVMVGRIEIGENPEILWERPEFERLYVRLLEEYELRERQRALERKLGLINRTAETLLELLHNKRSLRVEWYIVILILADIAVNLALEFL